jgi:tRNA1(Val) A37 N6-methylase TrmN6
MTQNDFEKWVNSYSDFMKPEDGNLYVIRKPSDLERVYEDLESMGV